MKYEEYQKKYQNALQKSSQSKEPSQQDTKKVGAYQRYREKYRNAYQENFNSKYASMMDNFTTAYEKFASDANTPMNYRDAGKRYGALSASSSSLRKQAEELMTFLNGNSDLLPKTEYDNIVQSLNQSQIDIDKAMDWHGSYMRYYNQFKTEDEYDTAQRYLGYQKKYDGKSYDELESILGDMEDGEEKQWLSQYAPSAMTSSDYKKRIEANNSQIQELEDHISEITNLADMMNMSGESEADKARYDGLIAKYGSTSSMKSQIEALKAENYEYENQNKYRFLSDNADYSGNTGYVSTESGSALGKMWSQYGMGYDDLTYEYINRPELRDEIRLNASIFSRDTKQETMFEKNGYELMTDDEIANYNYLYSTQGKKAAEEYLDYLSYTLNERKMQGYAENAEKLATEHPVFASAISVPANLMSGIGLVDIAGQNAKRAITGEYIPIDYNSGAMLPTVASSTIRGTVSNNIADATGRIQLDEEEHPVLSRILNGKSLGDVYQLGMSMADSAAIIPLGGAGTVLLGGSAGSQGVLDALEAGASDSQALTMGILNGAFEMLFEKVSLDNLLKGDGQHIVKSILSQAFVEGSEEFNTTLANTIADTLVMAKKSGIQTSIREYMEQGLTEKEATIKALEDIAIQMGWDFVGGAISGGAMGAMAAPIQNYQYHNAEASQLYGSDPGALVSEALELNPDNKLANKMQDRLDNGKKVSGRQLYNLAQQNEKAINAQDMETIRQAASQRLTELGETEDVKTVADALAKQAAGMKLSSAERNAIAESLYGKRVANELNAQNIRSGDYTSAWAEKLDTNRINVEEYSRLVQEAQSEQTVKTAQVAQDGVKSEQQETAQEVQKPARMEQVEPVADSGATVSKTESVGKDTNVPTKAADKSSATAEKSSAVESTQEESTVSIEDASKKYGAQAVAMVHTYQAGQDVEKYDAAYGRAYEMGYSGVSLAYMKKIPSTAYLTDTQKELAWEAGKAASDMEAAEKAAAIGKLANGKTGWKKGAVRGDGVTVQDLNTTLNKTQGKAYKVLSTIAEATGIDIVLYRSELKDGKYQGAQGQYKPSEPGTLYIDLNAGVLREMNADELSKYTMLRTFSHEFTHFIENWNPVQYNEFRRVVFDTLDQRGENVEKLIAGKQKGGMSYDAASREVIAESMTDILPDANFVETLANEHKTIFQKLLDKLKEFLSDLKEYFSTIGSNRSREANALKEQVGDAVHYVENIVKMFDQVAVQAVENYQKTVATDEVIAESATTTTEDVQAETKTEVEEEVKPEPEVKTSEPYVSENGYTITDNAEFGSIEISFDGKPSETVRNALKENKFRWHKQKQVWYGKAGRETIIKALDNAYASHKEALEKAGEALRKSNEDMKAWRESITPKESTEETAQEVTAPAQNDAYTSLSEKLRKFNRVDTEHFVFRLFNKDGKWHGKVDAAETDVGRGIMVSNARGVHYTSEVFDTRQEAMDDILAVARNNKLLDESPVNIKEETQNGENEDNQRPVLEPEPDGQGTARLLDELQTEDVQGTGGQRESARPDSEGGREAERHGDRTDTAAGSGGSEGSSQSGDLRRDGGDRGRSGGRDGTGSVEQGDVGELRRNDESSERDAERGKLSQEEKQAKAKKLQDTVSQQVAQKSKEAPKGKNFVIGESLNLPSGEKARFKANVDAIRLIKQLETEGRYATAAEQEALSKYVGWGGLANAFGEMRYNQETRKREMVAKPGWEKEFAEFRQLVTDGIITEEEYSAMSASTKNAHYTSMEVIKAMYDGLEQLGFTGGRMLEPSSGVGNFVGGMPVSMSQNVKSWTMVELDRITGQIAKYLYPNADVRIQGFETANIPDNYMDVAIGNVPFGNYGVVDRSYPKRITKAIHNYFFAKTLDKVRPGGLVMFITSSFTMNGQDTSIRQYIMDRADLLGAIRLPNTAFSGNAGTEVVTDILVLKKRAPGTEYGGEAFLQAPYRNIGGTWQGANVNEYFDNHPEMVLGTAELSRGMYGANSLTYSPLTDKGTLGDQIREAFQHITGKMDYKTQISQEKANFAVERAGKKTKEGGLEVKDGKVFRNENGNLSEVSSDKAMAERVSGLLGIRDAYRQLVNYLQQGQDAKYIKAARKELNKAYDDFVKKYGPINSPKNKSAIAEDPDSYSLLSLENYDAKKKTATKADIFTKDTISPNKTVTHVDDIASGVIVSINRTGGIDTGLIAKLTGKTQESVTRELIDSRMAFKTKDGSLETPETYLSGNVRAKLREAEALAPMDKDFQNNVEELRRVIPKDIPFNDIFVAVGTPWIPNNVYADFIAETLGGYNNENSYRGPDVTVGRTNSGEFKIVVNNKVLSGRYQNTQKWGTKRRTFLDLMTALMSNGSLTVNDYIEDGNGRKKAVVNKVETAAAQAKAEEISKEFQEWLWKDETRRTELASLYNETFNALVPPKYSGKNLTVNGLNAEFSLREHQANAVQRIISSGGNTLLAHKVGAGKTLEMAAAAMKLRELGIVKKPMFVVPKSLVAQWGVEFKRYFPAAKLLVADEKSFTKGNRKTFSNRIANGDYDAVIVSYEQFEKIPMSAAYKQEFYQQQIDEILDAIAEEKAESQSGKGITVKEMEKKKAQLEKKQAELTKKPKDEDNIDFDLLGIDSLFVDEAHNFKNLQYVTRMNNISGLGNTNGSQRAFDLYTKVRYLQGLNGGRGIVFATATPVMNSMAEMYIMQKYLQSDMLEQLGLKTFDAWAKQFGEVVNSVEIKPSGQGFRVKQTFSNFRNLNELQLLFRSFSDVLTDVPGLKIPKMKGGKVNTVVCEPGQFQKDYMAELEKRADNVKNVDPSVDNMLKITSDGRKVSYTQRMIDPTLPYEPGCKIYRCCENVLAEYKQSNSIKGTQIIFCDMATPKGRSSTATNTEISDDTDLDTSSAQLYDDMKAYLVKKGIPAKEIAFIHDADTDEKKKQLFADVNDGKVRVLIGSTGKMGVGMNAQKRIVAIHHLDAPWRPGDVEQRDGRAFRQKNMNEEVSKYTYVTEGSFDARLWDILDRKQHFIEQIMNGEDIGRSAEDTGDVTLSAAEVKALASGNPMIMEQVQLSNDLTKLNDLKKAHNSSIVAAKAKLLSDEQRISTLERNIANCKADIKARVDTYSDGKFSMRVGNQTFTEKKDAGIALSTAIVAKAKQGEFVTVGKFAGFDLRVIKQGTEYTGHITGKQGYKFNVYTENTTYMVNHIISIVEGLENRLHGWTNSLAETIADRDAQEKMIAEPFAKQAELDQKLARYNEVMAILNPKEEQVIGDNDSIQEQSRDYLEDEQKKYSYAWFSAKPDMVITTVDDTSTYQSKDDRKRIIDNAVANAKNAGTVNSAGNAVIHVADNGADVIVSKTGIRHSLDRRASVVGPVAEHVGEILKNAIQVNELNPRSDNIKDSYILMSVAKNKKNEPYIVSFVINRYSNELVDMDVMYSVNAKTEPAGSLSPSITAQSTGYFTGSTINIANYLDFVNQYFPDVLPEDVLKHYGHDSRPEGTLGSDALYQERSEALTDRDILEMAAENVQLQAADMTEGERDALRIFQDRLGNLRYLQQQRKEQGRLYKEQQFGPNVDRKAAEQTHERMKILDAQIQRASDAVLDVQEKPVLRRVLQNARTIVEQAQREKDDQKFQRWLDRRDNAAAIKKYRERIRTDVNDLTGWILKPDNKSVVNHVPEALKNAVVPFLTSIDFMSKRQLRGGDATVADKAFLDQLNKLKKVMNSIGGFDLNDAYEGYADLPPDFMQNLDSFIQSAQELLKSSDGEFIINKMTAAELKSLSKVVRNLKQFIKQMNRFHNNAMFQHVYDAGDNSIDFLSQMKPAENTGGVSNFLFWQQMRPAYAFERFGDGGKAVYDELRRGQAKLAFNTQEILEFSEKAYKTEEVKAWEKQVKTIDLGPAGVVKMKVSQIMSLYELSKREQAMGHILGEGIRVATFKDKNGKKISDPGHTLTPVELNQILSELTPRQREVADKLQQFMQSKGGEWGNYVSMARFGERQFGEEHYFPINSDGRYLQVDADEKPGAASLYALLNMGFTKQVQEKAKNRIVVYSIFDVFSNHMASMAQYNAMALPLVDTLKWFNYQQVDIHEDGTKTRLGSVRDQMDRVYGTPVESRPGSGKRGYAQNFVINIIKAFNGTEAQGSPMDERGMKPLHKYNRAQVAYNFRVVIQQPMAITRAADIIDYASIIRGMKLSPAAIQKNIQEMQKYSGIAAWKSLGFYDVNISRGLTQLIKHDESRMDKFIDVGMKGAETADTLTWAAMWSACKEEVIRKQHLTPKNEGFYEAVTKLFEDVIYKTQVVDSVLTKNEFMRDKGFWARAVGSFMSEPTTTASMLLNRIDEMNRDRQRGLSFQRVWQKNGKRFVRTVYVYAVGAVILAAVQAVADAMRDDDDYETFLEKWLEAFKGNALDELMPFNKLPIVSDVYELGKSLLDILTDLDVYGNPPSSVIMQWYDSLVKGVEIIYDKISGEDTNYTWYGGAYKLLQAVSGMVGVPGAAIVREAVTAWNNTVGAMAPSLKVKSYDPGEKNNIRYAYQDGYLTAEEATAELLNKGLVDTEDEAYFTIQGWDDPDGSYSRFDAVYDAVRNGGDFDAAMDELTNHGYTDKDVLSNVKGQIGTWYRDGEITKQQAVQMMGKYLGMDSDDITATVNKWSSKVVTGIAFEDIKDSYLNSEITEKRAVDMYVLYGGYTQEKATETVKKWKYEKETGVAYDDMKDAFMDGELSEREAVSARVEYGGVSQEDAEDTVAKWKYEKETGVEGAGTGEAKDYYEFAKPNGISADTYHSYYEQKSGIHADVDADGKAISGSKKEKILRIIDALPLSSAQKDALYFAEGWAESRLYEAPWH
ncbi:MAG: SNF2-related protein [Firmicutes bacterium]|nr:SNF2-related protein [Bacillota bacterium]MDY6160505.1 SNF2-related protein [Candidatus Faecousia sp.]